MPESACAAVSAQESREMKQKGTLVVPKGFQTVEAAKFPESHDFRKTPKLAGKVTEIKSVPGRQKRRIMYVADSSGEIHAVWENAMLSALFARARVGNEVYIEFKFSDAEAGKQRAEEYITAIK